MYKPKISIIVPVYNVEKYLPTCLDSLVNQTFRDIEIICINDGSTDKSLQILQEYVSKDTRIKIINQNNTGSSGARNVGLGHAKGEYVMFVDSDDWIEFNTCELAYAKANNHQCDVVMWPYISEHENLSNRKAIFKDYEIIFDEFSIKNKIHRRFAGLLDTELAKPENADSIVTVWGKLYKTSIIKDNNILFVDLNLIGTSEDALFNLSLFGHVKKAVYINEYLNHYRKDNPHSLTTAYKHELFSQWQYLFELIKKYLDQNGMRADYYRSLENRIALSIIGLGLNLLASEKSVYTKIKEVKNILSHQRYREAYKQLPLKYFPLHWCAFFACAKMNFAIGVYILLCCIKKCRGK